MGQIIGFAGCANSGKDTAASFLVQHGFVRVAFADPLKRIARTVFDFSVEQLWGPSAMRNAPDERYPREHGPWVWGSDESLPGGGIDLDPTCACCGVEYYSKSQCYLTPRFALQTLGTEWGRTCYEHVWIDHGIRVAEALLSGAGSYVYEKTVGLVLTDGLAVPSLGAPQGVAFTDVRFPNEARRIREKGFPVYLIDKPGAGLSGAAAQHASESALSREMVSGVVRNDGTLEEFRVRVEALLHVTA